MLTINDRNELRVIETICKDLNVDYSTHFRMDREGFVDPSYTEIHFKNVDDMDVVIDLYNEMC